MKLTCAHVVFVAVVLLIQVGAVAAPRNPASPKSDLRGTEQHPLIIKTIPNREELRRDAEYRTAQTTSLLARTQEDQEHAKADKLTARLGEITAWILAIQAIAFFVQALQLQRSVKEMKSATRVAQRAARAASRSTDAAIKANDLTRDALIADQRPWLAIEGVPTLYFFRPPTKKWQLYAQIELRNTGKTPAHNVLLLAQILNLASDDDLERLHLEFCEQKKQGSYESTAEIWYPGENRILQGDVTIPDAFQSAPLPDRFVISGCIYYQFTQVQSAHMTSFLYNANVNNSIAKQWWSEPQRNTLHQGWFDLYRRQRGWRAT